MCAIRFDHHLYTECVISSRKLKLNYYKKSNALDNFNFQHFDQSDWIFSPCIKNDSKSNRKGALTRHTETCCISSKHEQTMK